MNIRPTFALCASATLAITLSFAGCKSSTAPPANQANSPSQPAAGQPASGEPSSMQPAAPAQLRIASRPAGSRAGTSTTANRHHASERYRHSRSA